MFSGGIKTQWFSYQRRTMFGKIASLSSIVISLFSPLIKHTFRRKFRVFFGVRQRVESRNTMCTFIAFSFYSFVEEHEQREGERERTNSRHNKKTSRNSIANIQIEPANASRRREKCNKIRSYEGQVHYDWKCFDFLSDARSSTGIFYVSGSWSDRFFVFC